MVLKFVARQVLVPAPALVCCAPWAAGQAGREVSYGAGLAPPQARGARGAPGVGSRPRSPPGTARPGSPAGGAETPWNQKPAGRQHTRPRERRVRCPPLPSILSGGAGRNAALPSSSGVGSACRALAAAAPRCRSCPSALRAARAFSLCLKVGEETGAGGRVGLAAIARAVRAAPRGRPGEGAVCPFFRPHTGTGSGGGGEGAASSGRAARPRGERCDHGHGHWHRAGPGSALRPPPPGEPGACREPGGGRRRPQPPSAGGAAGRSGAAGANGQRGPCPRRPHGCLFFVAGCLLWIIKSRRSRHYRASVLKPEKEVSYRAVPVTRTGCGLCVFSKTSVSFRK